MAIKCGRNVTSTPHWHLTTDQVRACYNGHITPSYTREGTLIGRPNTTTAPPTNPTPTRNVTTRPKRNVNDKQAKYYTDLVTALGLPNLLSNFDGWTISPELDRLKDLRLALNERKRLAALAARIPATDPKLNNHPRPTRQAIEDGVYYRNGRYYRVVHAVHGSGRQYAQVFDVITKRFTKAAGALYQLTPEHAITADQAAVFGKLYGKCVFCSKALTDPRSIHAGYGETCAGNHGLPWGDQPDYDTTGLHHNNAK